MILHPLLVSTAVVGLLSFLPYTSLAAPISGDTGGGQLDKRLDILGGVYTDYNYGGIQQALKSGCNPFSKGIASEVSSFYLFNYASCKFYEGGDCQTGFRWGADGRSDATLKGYDNNRVRSAFCNRM